MGRRNKKGVKQSKKNSDTESHKGDKHQYTKDIHKNELGSHAGHSPCTSAENTDTEKKSTKYPQSIAKENVNLKQSHPVENKHNINEYDINSLTSLETQAFEARENEICTECISTQTKENESRKVQNKQLLDKFDPPITPAANAAIEPKSHKESSTKKAEEIRRENENMTQSCPVEGEDNNSVPAHGSQCTAEGYFSENLKLVISNESGVTVGVNSMSDVRVDVYNNSQFSGAPFPELGFDVLEMYGSAEVKTLEDALQYFRLSSCLEKLDISLEDVRRHRITEEDHKECFKKIDNDIKKLSLDNHPDTAMRRRPRENEMTTSEERQTTINAVRTVLRYLNAEFLADISTDHKFQFYSKLNISLLSNEKEIKCRIYEMRFKLSMISRIKQQNIILQIREFLFESKMCIVYYIQNMKDEFKKSCNSVLFQLHQCIEGFKRLCVELEEMEKKCKIWKDELTLPFIQNMAKDFKRDLKLLDSLEKSATSSMEGNYQFFSTEEIIDPYFVRPLIWYTNVIVMCKVMAKSDSFWDNFKLPKDTYPKDINYPAFNEFSELTPLYFLTAYYCGHKEYENIVKHILNNDGFSVNRHSIERFKDKIKLKFREILFSINENVRIKFDVHHYTEVTTDNFLVLEIEKCMSMMNEFQEKKQELSDSIKEIQKKTGKIEGNYDDIMKTSKDLNSKIEEMVDTNNKIEAIVEANSSKIEELLQKSKKLLENSQ